MSQTAFAEACGVKKLAQITYEKGERRPDTEYLEAACRLGADVLYILTGRRERPLSKLDDRARLRLAIEAVEEGLALTRRKLPPDKKAELIDAAYDLIAQGEERKEELVRVLKLVA